MPTSDEFLWILEERRPSTAGAKRRHYPGTFSGQHTELVKGPTNVRRWILLANNRCNAIDNRKSIRHA